MEMEKYKVVIPAAGQGRRMNLGKNKQFLLLNKIPLLIHTLRVFEEDSLCKSVILVVNKDEIHIIEKLLREYKITKVDHIVAGGKERQQSVFEGLKVIEDNPIVLIHDGARPFIKIATIHQLVLAVLEKGAAVVGTPVKDTIKEVNGSKICKTVPRDRLCAVQTPQAFRHSEILEAHKLAERAGFEATDDASIMENAGKDVFIIEGDYENIKITTPEDIIFAEAILNKRRGE